MIQDSQTFRSHCPINFVLEIFGDKWTLLIVRDLMFKGKSSYSDFLVSEEGISTATLADRLQKLERHGVVEKHIDPEKRSRLIYNLTGKGRDLLAVMVEMTAWSAKHDGCTNTPKLFLHKYNEDREKLMAFFRAQIKCSEE